MPEFPAGRVAQCDTCWNRQSCEDDGFADCRGYWREPRCPDHPDKPLVPRDGNRVHRCPECGLEVCMDCGLLASEVRVDWSSGLCRACSRHRRDAREFRAKRVAWANTEFAWAAMSVLSAKTDWELAVRLADLAEKRRELKEVGGG